MATLVERLRAVEHHDWCCRFASAPEGCAPDGCDCGHDVADEAAARLEEVEARAEQMPALFEKASALEEALRADVIRDVLREEAWQGRWTPLPETNIYPLAAHTADVLAKALAERTNTASAAQLGEGGSK